MAEYDAKYPKAVASLCRDQAQLLTFDEFPAEHWRHLRTTNIIESPFATVRLRQRVTKGAASRTKALMMAFKLLAMVEERWRKEVRYFVSIAKALFPEAQRRGSKTMAEILGTVPDCTGMERLFVLRRIAPALAPAIVPLADIGLYGPGPGAYRAAVDR